MSLIAVAGHVRGPRTLTRTLLVLVVVTVGIIAGLLAMHSLNAHPSTTGHADTVAIDTTTPAAAGHHDAAVAPGPATQDASSGCVDCGDHDMAWMACVLALLVAVLLLTRPGNGWRTPVAAAGGLTNRTIRWPAQAHALPPPSLTVLCISRT